MSQALKKTYGLDFAELNEDDSAYFRDQIKRISGITLTQNKNDLVQSRIQSRLWELKMSTFTEYRKRLESLPAQDPEWEVFVNLLTTNKTDWFREQDHFDFLAEKVIPHLKDKEVINIWSAACSTGEEPYSIALLMNHLLPKKNYKILASDIDTEVLSIAQQGVYPSIALNQIPDEYLRGAIAQGTGEISKWMKVTPEIKNHIHFQKHNLIKDPPIAQGAFDIIFCRNVFIYFEPKTIEHIIEKFYHSAASESLLIISQTETLYGLKNPWIYVAPSIFIKTGGKNG